MRSRFILDITPSFVEPFSLWQRDARDVVHVLIDANESVVENCDLRRYDKYNIKCIISHVIGASEVGDRGPSAFLLHFCVSVQNNGSTTRTCTTILTVGYKYRYSECDQQQLTQRIYCDRARMDANLMCDSFYWGEKKQN